jgi:putative ABC transport system permease protein
MIRRGIRWLVRSRREIERDVADEIAFHLEMRRTALEREGVSPAEAEARARAEFGDAAGLRASLGLSDARRQRRRRRSALLEDLVADVRIAIRSLRRAPAFTGAVLGTLALATGATVATFAVLNAVVLRPLPYADPERLVNVLHGRAANITMAEEIERRVPAFSGVSGVSQWGLTLTGVGEAAELEALVVEPAYFDVLGVRAALGRTFREDERAEGSSDVVVLSDALWRDRFGGDRDLVGRRVQLDGYGHRSREVIGILPPDFVPALAAGGRRIDAFIPLRGMAGRTMVSDSTWYLNGILARLAPGASLEASATGVRAAMQGMSEQTSVLSEETVASSGAVSLLEGMVGDTRSTLWMLLGAVALVLVLACANTANLLLARGERRRGEIAARSALGASRGRLVRGLLTESFVLAVAGTALGMLLARFTLDFLRVAEISGLPRTADLGFDIRVVTFATAAALLCGTLFGVLPAWRVTGEGLRGAAGTRVHGQTRQGRHFGSVLISVEVALAMVLITSAALLIASYRTLRAVDPGLDAGDVFTVRVAPAPTEYPSDRARVLYDDLLERVRALPGVRAAGAIQLLPFGGGNWSFPYLAAGHDPPVDAPLPSANFRVVTPDYFEALDVPLIAGRWFDAGDRAEGEAVGIINRMLAEELWPGEDAVGREILLFGNVPFRVVGVAGDMRQHGLDQNARPEMYRPFSQWTVSTMHLMVEHDGSSGALETALRAAVRDLDGNVPVLDAAPLAYVIDQSVAGRTFIMRVLAAFGFTALLLGAIGVYGVMTYTAGARVPEYGVRIALGATRGAVERGAFLGGMRPVLIGVLAGTAASLLAGRALAALLYEVAPNDPRVLAAAALVLTAVAAFASWLPARRFSRVDPIRVLGSQ